jgi:tRNA pseudouridine55 synthase
MKSKSFILFPASNLGRNYFLRPIEREFSKLPFSKSSSSIRPSKRLQSFQETFDESEDDSSRGIPFQDYVRQQERSLDPSNRQEPTNNNIISSSSSYSSPADFSSRSDHRSSSFRIRSSPPPYSSSAFSSSSSLPSWQQKKQEKQQELDGQPEKVRELTGLLPVYKPKDWTSNDVVGKIKNILKFALRDTYQITKPKIKIGHGGTLDPIAEGVLILGLGKATTLLTSYLNGPKTYESIGLLGVGTDTYDTEGKEIGRKDASFVTKEALQASLNDFKGQIAQIPPMYSACQIDGKRLYQLARKGEEVDRKARIVNVYQLEIKENVLNQTPILPETFGIVLECSKGFYVRTLVDDIGKKLGTYASMQRLLRTKQGMFSINDCLYQDKWDYENILLHLKHINAGLKRQ